MATAAAWRLSVEVVAPSTFGRYLPKPRSI